MTKARSTLARLKWLANCGTPQEVQEFRVQNPGYIPSELAGWSARNLLRQIWDGGNKASTAATLILCGQGALRSIINSVKQAVAANAESPLSEEAALLLLPNRVDWPRGELVYNWPSDLQKDLHLLLKQSRLARVCANPDCGSPYFVARKVDGRYCSTDCADAMQNVWRSRWWREHGNEWREKRKPKTKMRASR